MFGHGEPVDLQIRHLEADIVRVRIEQVNLQLRLELAFADELRGLALVDSARAEQANCRSEVEEHAQTISGLQDRIADLIPKPRGA